MARRKPQINFRKMPSGQQRAHVSKAVSRALGRARDPRKLTRKHVEAAAAESGVPVKEVLARLKKRGIYPK